MQEIDTSPENVVRVLREAASMIDALAPKDIRKSFTERNFAANTLRPLADALCAHDGQVARAAVIAYGAHFGHSAHTTLHYLSEQTRLIPPADADGSDE